MTKNGRLLVEPAVEHLGDVGVVHQGQRLPLGLEPGQHLLGVHAGLDQLDRDEPLDRLGLLGPPDGPHAALADGLDQRVLAGDDGAGVLVLAGVVGGGAGAGPSGANVAVAGARWKAVGRGKSRSGGVRRPGSGRRFVVRGEQAIDRSRRSASSPHPSARKAGRSAGGSSTARRKSDLTRLGSTARVLPPGDGEVIPLSAVRVPGSHEFRKRIIFRAGRGARPGRISSPGTQWPARRRARRPLLDRQPTEDAQLHQFGLGGVVGPKWVQHSLSRGGRRAADRGLRAPDQVDRPRPPPRSARPSHGRGRPGSAASPRPQRRRSACGRRTAGPRPAAGRPRGRGRWLEGVAGSRPPCDGRELPQLVVDEREQVGGSPTAPAAAASRRRVTSDITAECNRYSLPRRRVGIGPDLSHLGRIDRSSREATSPPRPALHVCHPRPVNAWRGWRITSRLVGAACCTTDGGRLTSAPAAPRTASRPSPSWFASSSGGFRPPRTAGRWCCRPGPPAARRPSAGTSPPPTAAAA